MRHITKSDSRSSSLPLFIKLKCLPIFHLVRLNILVFMFKYQKGILPALFHYMFNTNSSFHDYQTRLRDNLRTPIIHSTIRTPSIRFTGVHEWNSINNDVKSSSTFTIFITLFKRHFIIKVNRRQSVLEAMTEYGVTYITEMTDFTACLYMGSHQSMSVS